MEHYANTISSDELRKTASIFIEVTNSEAGWAKIAKDVFKLREYLAEQANKKVVFYTIIEDTESKKTDSYANKDLESKLTVKYDVPTDDVLNLQYFFPYCDHLAKESIGLEVVLVLFARDNSTLQRASCYLCNQAISEPLLTIYTGRIGAANPFKKSSVSVELQKLRYLDEYMQAILPLIRVESVTQMSILSRRSVNYSELVKTSGEIFENALSNDDFTINEDDSVIYKAGVNHLRIWLTLSKII